MADSSISYRKLPGRGSGVASLTTLWEGDTHLLLVTSWPAGESYRRFFYGDIQAIILSRTARRLIINIVFGVILLLGAMPLLAVYFSDREPGWLVAGGLVAGVCLVFMLVNSLLGPTCSLQVQTPVQREALPTIRRLRRARQFLARIQPRIVAAQPVAASPLAGQPGTL